MKSPWNPQSIPIRHHKIPMIYHQTPVKSLTNYYHKIPIKSHQMPLKSASKITQATNPPKKTLVFDPGRCPKIHSTSSLFRRSKPATVEARRTAEPLKPLKLLRRGVDREPSTERSTSTLRERVRWSHGWMFFEGDDESILEISWDRILGWCVCIYIYIYI